MCPHLIGRERYSRLPALLRCKLSHADDQTETCPTCSGLIQGRHCATECFVKNEDFGDLGFVVMITAWKNLGACETPADRLWKDQPTTRRESSLCIILILAQYMRALNIQAVSLLSHKEQELTGIDSGRQLS